MKQQETKEKMTFVYPTAVLDAMRTLAKAHQRSFIGEIVWALREYIRQYQGDLYEDDTRQQDL